MAIEVYIPKFGQTVEEVTLLQWLVEDGAPVKKGQEILEIETDKTTFFVEAEGAGYLHRGPFEPGQVVPILTVVATIGGPDEKFVGGKIQVEEEGESKIEARAEARVEAGAAKVAGGKVFASPRARRLAAAEHVNLAAVTPTGGGGARVVERDVRAYLAAAPKATPLAEKLAAEAGIDLRQVAGTGPGGRITKEDIELAIKQAAAPAAPPPAAEVAPAAAAPAAAAPPPAPRPLPAAPLPEAEVIERVPLKGVRGII
ncbi:MAG: E3 binding domain-containing protein, partial [Anaerolineae bacterium]